MSQFWVNHLLCDIIFFWKTTNPSPFISFCLTLSLHHLWTALNISPLFGWALPRFDNCLSDTSVKLKFDGVHTNLMHVKLSTSGIKYWCRTLNLLSIFDVRRRRVQLQMLMFGVKFCVNIYTLTCRKVSRWVHINDFWFQTSCRQQNVGGIKKCAKMAI